jgi:hypothetical protein
VEGRSRELAEIGVLRHYMGMAMHYRPSRDMKILEDLVGLPQANEVDGGVVHLAKKEGHGTASL